jgi:uncharacterized protein YyaL (SSP411 family)
VCEETLDFTLRELTHPDGGFYSSLDADSEGKEGKFYVWTQEEIKETLGSDFEFFKAAYGITPQGNWEGKTILQRALDDSSLATRFKMDRDTVPSKLADCHSKLLTVRNTRIRPGTDDKVLVMWNALALSAFAEAGRYLNSKHYLDAAINNAHFLIDNLFIDGRLLRSWREGNAKYNAYLEDYAGLIHALLALYQSDPNPAWYAAALKLGDEMVAHFVDPNGGFFDTRDDHEIPGILSPQLPYWSWLPMGIESIGATWLKTCLVRYKMLCYVIQLPLDNGYVLQILQLGQPTR